MRNYGTTWHESKELVCFVDMEGNTHCLPYSFSVVADGFRQRWLMNPCSAGADAKVEDIEVIASSSQLSSSSSRAREFAGSSPSQNLNPRARA